MFQISFMRIIELSVSGLSNKNSKNYRRIFSRNEYIQNLPNNLYEDYRWIYEFMNLWLMIPMNLSDDFCSMITKKFILELPKWITEEYIRKLPMFFFRFFSEDYWGICLKITEESDRRFWENSYENYQKISIMQSYYNQNLWTLV